MSREIDLSLLEQYLSGEIPAEAVRDLEGNSLTAEELVSGIEEYQEVILQLRGSALKKDLQAIGGRVAASHSVQAASAKNRSWWWAAAGLLLVAAATFLWQQQNTRPVFEDYFTPIDQLITFRGVDGQQTHAKGLEAYGRGNYQEAYELLGRSKLKDPGLLFYYGVSALGSAHWAEARAAFEKAGTDTDNKYYQQTRWYLALAYWQLDRTDLALEQLEAISKEDYEYKKARQLIDELR